MEEAIRTAVSNYNDLALRACSDEAAFTELYNLTIDEIFRFVMKRVGHRETAEDVTSDIFRKVFLHLKEYTPTKASFRTWMYRIATNAIVDYYRIHRNENKPSVVDLEETAHLASDSPSPHDLVLADDQKAMVQKCLAELKADHQKVLHLKYIEGFGNQEIAEILDISSNNVGVLLHRALKAAKKVLQPTATL